ncbi:RING-box protein 2 isoform X5 [Myotis myotis]|uniref:RING-box protein 2 isoform X5 n=1 Tax=Myotis myotis TaxID=51298 RepID=UPI00174E3A26|nr:RING-box protein 2 isoform X5 [Myotis myotis]
MADVEDAEEPCALSSHSGGAGSKSGGDKMFSLKKWNAVAMWSWDVECDTCAICRVQMPVLDVKLKTNKRIVLSWATKVILAKCFKQFKAYFRKKFFSFLFLCLNCSVIM